MSTSILIVDDQSLVSRGIAMILSAEHDLEVIGEVGDGAQAITVARRDQPDVVLMDVRMPTGREGLAATRELTADSGSDRTTKVLILTTFDDDETVYGALRAGASGFVLKQAAPADLVTAIRHVAAGDAWLDPTVAPRVIARLASLDTDAAPTDLLDRLTPRECDVLRLVARGMTNDEIAAHFTLSEATVRTHMTRILMKTGSSTRAKAVVLAYESGLVVPRRTENRPRRDP